ncbi:MAG TPA: VOC family protein [Candidatus Polarisedimenticolia bacterium]|nr:VOC family protein [Candidatus Polarisedimenticolia bacterium]
MVRKIPQGYSSVTPYLVNEGAERVIRFLRQAFGAAERFPPMKRPDGTIMHAQMRIGDSVIMLAEASVEYRAMPSCFYLYVEDVDGTYRRALQAGAISVTEPKDQFYGDRSAGVRDPAGNFWWIATHKEDVPGEEMERRFRASLRQPSAA